MKTKFVWKSIVLLSAAVLAVFFLFACDLMGGKTETLSGSLKIEGDPYITAILEAKYTGTENADYTWQWYKDGVKIPGADSELFSPLEAGKYSVTLSAKGYESLTSNEINVTVPAWAKFFGFWNYDGGPDLVNQLWAEKETLTISHNAFSLLDSDNDGFDFRIDKWTKLASIPSDYTDAYELTGACYIKEDSGFKAWKDKTKITLYMKGNDILLRRNAGDTYIMLQLEYQKGDKSQLEPSASIVRLIKTL